jgi:F420-non-reducing hydrogenase iron-sulfur subunit
MARLKYPPNVKIVRVPCSGRISPELVLRTFREGADGVMVLGCHNGDCHYSSGNHRTAKRMPVLKKLLEYTGIEPERLHVNWVSAAEGEKFATVIQDFTETIRNLPPIAEVIK